MPTPIRIPDPTRRPTIDHTVVYAEPDIFAAWPANNGLWAWEDGEILTACVTGRYVAQIGHNLVEPYAHRLLRTLDGGASWQVETPDPYVGEGGPPRPLNSPLDFSHPDLALRVVGEGYHGSAEPAGGFHVSHDRGRTWSGPFAFNGLHAHPQLALVAFTPRTDYLVLGPHALLVCLSVRRAGSSLTDRAFCAHTADGGRTFTFRGWLAPTDDPHRSVMPSTVRLADGRLLSALRRRRSDANICWLDLVLSADQGFHWAFQGRIAETGSWNGNPPALTLLADERLCCVFGDRSRQVMAARFSADLGCTWPEETLLRDDFYAPDDEPDLGYPRLTQLPDGRLLAVYYWATRDHPQQHIAATSWQP